MKSGIELFVIERVKQIREEKNISQASLAKALKLSNGFIGQVESPNNAAKYNLNHLNEIAKIFNCKLSDFFPVEPIDSELLQFQSLTEL